MVSEWHHNLIPFFLEVLQLFKDYVWILKNWQQLVWQFLLFELIPKKSDKWHNCGNFSKALESRFSQKPHSLKILFKTVLNCTRYVASLVFEKTTTSHWKKKLFCRLQRLKNITKKQEVFFCGIFWKCPILCDHFPVLFVFPILFLRNNACISQSN